MRPEFPGLGFDRQRQNRHCKKFGRPLIPANGRPIRGKTDAAAIPAPHANNSPYLSSSAGTVPPDARLLKKPSVAPSFLGDARPMAPHFCLTRRCSALRWINRTPDRRGYVITSVGGAFRPKYSKKGSFIDAQQAAGCLRSRHGLVWYAIT
jgi:hypothetical protein